MRIPPIALPVLMATAIALPAHADDRPPTLVDRSEKVAEVRGLTGLDVDNARGVVQLRPSADGRLHVVATRIFRMGDEATARHYASETTVQTGPRGGRYVVAVHYPRRIESGFSFFDLFSERGRRRLQLPSVEVRLEIQVPPAFPARVTTASGDIEATALAAPLHANAASGDVHLSALRGAADVETASGDVLLEQVAGARVRAASGNVTADGVGALDAGTASGDITVHGARDSLVLGTQSGDVSVDDAPGGIRAETASGDIELLGARGRVRIETVSGAISGRLRAPLAHARLESTSGDIDLELAPGLAGRLVASTTSGSIDCGVPVTILRQDRNHLDARLGPGGPVITLSTTSGNLTVKTGGTRP